MNARTFVFVDAPNVDGVLGKILGHRPLPHERPRWDRVKKHLPSVTKPHFVLDQRYFDEKVYPLRRALRSLGYQVDVVSTAGGSAENDDPVDQFILNELDGICRAQEGLEPYQVTLLSHDHCYVPTLRNILRQGSRTIVVGFREEMSPDLLGLENLGGEMVDLEHDLGAFLYPLPRPRLPLYCSK